MSDLKIVNPGSLRRGRESGESGEKHHHHKPATFARFPFQLTEKTIYVRPDGSDKHHDGKSPRKAFKTVQFALTTIPTLPESGASYTIDCTGVTETFPTGYQTPNILFSNPGGFLGESAGGGSSPTPWYTYQNGLTITATPQLAALPGGAPTDSIITAADVIAGANVALTGGAAQLAAINIPGPGRAGWANHGARGSYLVRSVKSGTSNIATCVIYDSDANNLYLCNDPGSLNGGAGPLVLAPGEEIQIVQPSATFNGSAFQAWGISAPNFQGINFAGGVQFANANGFVPTAELCTLAGCFLIGISGNGAELNGCNFTTNFTAQPIPALCARCLFSDMAPTTPFSNPFYFAGNLQTFTDVVFDNTCPTLTNGYFQTPLPNNWGLVNVLFQGSQGDAIYANSGEWVLANVEIDASVAANGTAGNAITVDSGTAGSPAGFAGIASMVLTNVQGTGNAGAGLRTNDGVQVRVTDTATNPMGAVGQDIVCGDLPARTWLNFYSSAPVGQQYDITAVGPAGATGTGSRVYQR